MDRKIHTTTATRKISSAPPAPPKTAVRLSNEARNAARAEEPAMEGMAEKLEWISGYLSFIASTKPGTEFENARERELENAGAS